MFPFGLFSDDFPMGIVSTFVALDDGEWGMGGSCDRD